MYYIILIIYYILGSSFFIYYSFSDKYKKYKKHININSVHNYQDNSHFVIDTSLTENLL